MLGNLGKLQPRKPSQKSLKENTRKILEDFKEKFGKNFNRS